MSDLTLRCDATDHLVRGDLSANPEEMVERGSAVKMVTC